MAKNFDLEESTQEIIRTTIGASSVDAIVDLDYPDIIPRNQQERNIAEKYLVHNRGSARIKLGCFYTKNEFDERIEKIKKLALP